MSDFALHRFLACCLHCEIQNEISECKISKFELSRSQKLQNYASSHYPTTIFVLQARTQLFRRGGGECTLSLSGPHVSSP